MTNLSNKTSGKYGEILHGSFALIEARANGIQSISPETPTILLFDNVVHNDSLLFSNSLITVSDSFNGAIAIIVISTNANNAVLEIQISNNGVDWNTISNSTGNVSTILELSTNMQIRTRINSQSSITISSLSHFSAIIYRNMDL